MVAALLFANMSFATIVIDNFGGPHTYTNILSFGLPANSANDPSALGGKRLLGARYFVDLDTEDANKSIDINIGGTVSNALVSKNIGLNSKARNIIYIGYDGAAGVFVVSPEYGLGGIDLTDGGSNNRFELTLDKSAAITEVYIGLYTDSGDPVPLYSDINVPIAGTDQYSQTLLVPFDDLVGDADFTNIDTIHLWIESNASESPIQLSNFRVTGSHAPAGAYLATPDAAIVDNSTADFSLVVADNGQAIADVNLYLDLSHTFASDLEIQLFSPNGTAVKISNDLGGSLNDIFKGLLFDDEALRTSAGNYVSDYGFANNVTPVTLAAQQGLAAFDGEVATGVWTLEIADDEGGDTGTLHSWALEIEYHQQQEPQADAFRSVGNSTGAAITAGVDVMQTLMVTDIGGVLCGMDFDLLLEHSLNADLDITLTSPQGITSTITTDNGGINGNVFAQTTFNHGSGNEAVTRTTYADGVNKFVLSPESPISVFDGFNPAGEWTLNIVDDAAGNDGTLNAWGIEYALCDVPDSEFCAAIKASNGKIVPICL